MKDTGAVKEKRSYCAAGIRAQNAGVSRMTGRLSVSRFRGEMA
jgi:hypothetical protein